LDRDRLRACSGHDLIDTAGQLAATLSATHAALLEVLTVIDERELWRADGCCSFQDWITMRFGVSRKTAHEWVETERSLVGLPHLARAFADGELSWDKTKAVAAMADPECDEAVTSEARYIDAARLESAARRARAVSLEEAEQRQRERFFALRRSPSMGGVRLSGFLPDVDGETLIKAIERLADDVPKDADRDLYPSLDERHADALVLMASGQLAAEQQLYGERAMVVAHVDLTPYVDPTPLTSTSSTSADAALTRGELQSELVIAPETAARLMCDAVVEPGSKDEGRAIGIDDKTRQPPQWMRRKLMHRDVGCRFPGCTRIRLVHAHHQVHWPHGPTQPDNLLMLCRFHHRKMHEGRWSLRGSPEGLLEFVKPSGEILTSELPQLSPEVRRRILAPTLPDG
jgi:hypothetical protein